MTDETVLACPECDRASVHHNNLGDSMKDLDRDLGPRYRCPLCGETFDDGVERAPDGHRNGLRGLAGKLSKAHADEVSR